MKRLFSIFILILFVIAGCLDDELTKINPDDISYGSLKIHKDGMLVKDISLLENEKLLIDAAEAYNNAEFISFEEEENENHVNIDPIFTDGPLEEEYSASHFNMDSGTEGDNFYIGYKGDNVFKVIAGGEISKNSFNEYFIESKELKEIILENG
ncbi:hypothetical protein E3U55_15930 [Filobacillus milosensis]|uniref:Uncharacterized protein n=1 Tax=Filobacillus milosensis TaxID=94137 RepID=A0A4Y8IET4_9BACI|nr:hypothetical protein [Filobacillus milosensis]TFB13462.1 hypothetical protein E3U55_15930 [Filobacillus milosensis]